MARTLAKEIVAQSNPQPLTPAVCAVAASADGGAPVPVQRQTYGQILKSSAVVGGSSVFKLALGSVRSKAMALLLGPNGVGLLALFGLITDIAQNVAGMGVNTSGVRQIASAVGTGESTRIARTVTTLRRVALILGALGALLLVVFSRQVSLASFGDHDHARQVAWLSVAVFFGAVSAGQTALVQGMRRIADLARLSVIGALAGTLISIPIIYFLGERGVVPSLICVAVMGTLSSWWQSRKVRVERVVMSLSETASEASGLLKLGVVFMLRSVMAMGVAYLVRVIVVRKGGLTDVGCFSAAWTLGGTYVDVILQAMGADFFPRLTAAVKDNRECNRIVNEQAEVGLLLAGPGVLATLSIAPLVIWFFYSAEFAPAVEILRWLAAAMMLRVASWPMGYILLAKGVRKPYIWSEVVGNGAELGLVWICVRVWGLTGTGIGFFGGYLVYLGAVYLIVRSVSGFRWSAANKRIGLLYGTLVGLVFAGWYVVPNVWLLAGASVLAILSGIFSLRTLCTLVPLDRFPGFAQRLLIRLRLAPKL
jgi:antigen flippase